MRWKEIFSRGLRYYFIAFIVVILFIIAMSNYPKFNLYAPDDSDITVLHAL